MNEKLNNLICELFDIKFEKNEVVKSQHYEKAAELRDKERGIERKLFPLIFPSNQLYDWEKLKNWIRIYLKDNYDIDYEDNNGNLKETIREIKLKQLGIK